jgi:cobalamin biosynthesis protein CobD/CbiB
MDPGKIVLLLSIAIDVLVGEPANRFHPVAWMGSFISRWQRLSDRYAQRATAAGSRPAWDLLSGAGLALGGGLAIVRDCASFGLPGHVRIAARLPEENARLLAALDEVL